MTLAHDLSRILRRGRVLTERDDVAPFGRDHTGRFQAIPRCVALPAGADELAALLAHCNERGIAVVAQGGNTGLVGGGIPMEGEVVIALRELKGIAVEGDRVRAGAGVTLGDIQRQLAPLGLEVPLDLASRDSATAGGIVATDAGGTRSFRHGRAGKLLAEATALSAAGDKLDPALTKLAVVGAEGTLSVTTEVVLRTTAVPERRATALIGCDDPGAALEIARRLAAALPSLEAAELVMADTLALVARTMEIGLPFPLDRQCYLLIENAGRAPLDDLVPHMEEHPDAIVAGDDAQRATLWKLRDMINETLRLAGPPLKLDVTLPPERVSEASAGARAAAGAGGAHVYGHLLEGHLHINLLREPAGAERDVLTLVVTLGGRVYGEHGVGRAKSRWLHLQGDDAGLRHFRELKADLDPVGILNPGIEVPRRRQS